MTSRVLQSLDLVLPLTLLAAIAFLCFLGPVVLDVPAPVGGNVLQSQLPAFSEGHLLGTDINGNDVWSRMLYGGRTSLQIALAVNLIGLLVGSTLGATSGYLGGRVDSTIMRLLDVLIAFPSLVLVLAVAQALGPSMSNTIWALALFSIPAFARLARSSTLRLREQPFMLAATLAGTRSWRVVLAHIGPNIAPQLMTFALLGMGISIVIEGALSLLGFGIPLPAPSWGNMIAQGQRVMSIHPHLLLLPSGALFLTALAFNLAGEALRMRSGE